MSAKKHRTHRKGGGDVGEPEVPASGKTAKPKSNEFEQTLPEEKDLKKMKNGGHANGGKAHHRPDRKHRAAGGRTGSPFTAAHSLKTPGNGGDGQGHEGDGPKGRELSD